MKMGECSGAVTGVQMWRRAEIKKTPPTVSTRGQITQIIRYRIRRLNNVTIQFPVDRRSGANKTMKCHRNVARWANFKDLF